MTARASYYRKKEIAGVVPCVHIAGLIGGSTASSDDIRGSGSLPFEHHALLDDVNGIVLHYATPPGDEHASCEVREDRFDAFTRKWPSWRVARLPSTMTHAHHILERARSRLGERKYNMVFNNCEHFVNWCFDGDASSTQVAQVSALGAIAASSATASLMIPVSTSVFAPTSTLTSSAFGLSSLGAPFQALGLGSLSTPLQATTQFAVQWTTESPLQVAAFGLGTSVEIAAVCGVGAAAATCAAAYGMSKWIQYGKAKAAARLPICVCNRSGQQVRMYLENLDAGYLGVAAAGTVHDMRAWFDVGSTKAVLGPEMVRELNPPAEEERFQRFKLHVLADQTAELDQRNTNAIAEVTRGDVVVYDGVGLSHILDPEGCREEIVQ